MEKCYGRAPEIAETARLLWLFLHFSGVATPEKCSLRKL